MPPFGPVLTYVYVCAHVCECVQSRGQKCSDWFVSATIQTARGNRLLPCRPCPSASTHPPFILPSCSYPENGLSQNGVFISKAGTGAPGATLHLTTASPSKICPNCNNFNISAPVAVTYIHLACVCVYIHAAAHACVRPLSL